MKRRHLFLDGIRGLAALFVLLHHISMADRDFGGAPLPAWLKLAIHPLDYGHYAVAVFIVLSGFCLMLPVVSSPDGRLRGGVKKYLVRRAKRICPPYYAALLMFLGLLAAVPFLRTPNGSTWDGQLPAFGFGAVASHLLLLHDLSPHWILKIDGPMWSVVIEWHIYFLFAFALLPAWRRWGIWPLLLVTAMLGIASHFVMQRRLDYLNLAYVTLFVVGMAGAQIASRGTRQFWGRAAGAATLVTIGYFTAGGGSAWARTYLSDLVVGAATGIIIVYCTRAEAERPLLVRVLDSPPAVWLGTVSYSLYLLHFPILPLLVRPIAAAGLAPGWRLALVIVWATAASLVITYLFHLCFERPFMPGHPTGERRAAIAAVTSPAP